MAYFVRKVDFYIVSNSIRGCDYIALSNTRFIMGNAGPHSDMVLCF